MIRTAARICFCVALSASSAEAADTEIRAVFGQTAEASDNRNLSPNPAGESYTSVSTLLVNAIARTATTSFEIIGDLAYRLYGGPGDRQTPDALDKGIVGIATYKDKTSKYYVTGSWRQRDASNVQLEEDGFVTIGGYVTTTSVIGGFERELNATDSVSFSATGTSTDFSDPSGMPFTSVSARSSWNRKVNRSLAWMAALEYQRLIYDNDTNTLTQFARATTGLQARLSPRLAFVGNVGVGWVKTDNDLFGPLPLASGSAVGVLADLLVTYNVFRDTVFVLSASQSIGPNSLGELTKRTAAGLSLRHEINHLSYWVLGSQFSRSTQTDDVTDLIVASATYGVRLAREWRSELSYTFRHRQSGGPNADSNTITLRLSRDLVMLP